MNQFKKDNNKKGFSLIELGVCLLIIGILSAATPNPFSPKRSYLDKRDCFANQKILQNATEMYSMKVSDAPDTVLPGLDFEKYEEILLKDGHLKETLPLPTDDCSYGFINLSENGHIFCKYHGSYYNKNNDKPVIPKYDTSLEKPFSNNYYNSKKKADEKREYLLKMERLKSPANIVPFFFISLSVLSFIIGIIMAVKKRNC